MVGIAHGWSVAGVQELDMNKDVNMKRQISKFLLDNMLIAEWKRWRKGSYKDYCKHFQTKGYPDKRAMIGGGRWGKRSNEKTSGSEIVDKRATASNFYLGKRPRPLRLGKRDLKSLKRSLVGLVGWGKRKQRNSEE